jgi:lipoate-protein ligase B
MLAIYEISAGTRPGLTGVWIDKRKIASIGVGVRHWITMHGFALNVCGNLAPFDSIIPCGIQNVTMTSIEKEIGRTFSPEEVSHRVAEIAFRSIDNLATEVPITRFSFNHDYPARGQRRRHYRQGPAWFAHFR